jgi:VIT1/CCC1 family predicted Fe2+/Mn2+ transporter
MTPRLLWKILVEAGLFFLVGGLVFWTIFAFFLAEKPARTLIKIGGVSFFAAYLGLHFLFMAVFGDNPSYLTVDDVGDRVDLKEAIAVLLAALFTYLVVRASRSWLDRK